MEQEKRNRIILIGPVSSGKTTLSQRITNREIVDNKTQALSLIDD
ncbi:MAG: ethanolamine utilization protein EutP, partial [Synergistaceae bacterium]|nr:ethanolamine utilization protein EutP [Synergistaceae bacterium]